MSVKKIRINQQIRAPEVRLIDDNGDQRGIVSRENAMQLAQAANLDLVEISPNAEPPVCRLMDFGKYQFEQSKRLAAQKKKQKRVELKEIKFRPTTDIGDYNVKLHKMEQFLERGDRVKVSLRFRGREMQHRELGMDLLNRIQKDLPEATVEQSPKMEGRQMTMVLIKAKANKAK